MPKPTNITPPRVPLTDTRTGTVSREWYQFFLSLFNLTGAGNNSLSIPDVNHKIDSFPDASNIALKNTDNTFTGENTFNNTTRFNEYLIANNGLRVYNGSSIDGYGIINGWLSQYGGSVILSPSYMSISSSGYFNVIANSMSFSTAESFNIGGKKFYVGSKDVEVWPDNSFVVRGVPITASTAPSDPSHLTNKAYVDAVQSFVFEQPTPSVHWVIVHPLNRYPSVTIVDSAGSVVLGNIVYTSATQIDLYFSGAFAGKAYLN